ncbi:hypothetical protein LTR28_000655 [Elasticomyces elasticus]|nr:hypothetical protein LTR28_000655 [Elasticomyces elasticus]
MLLREVVRLAQRLVRGYFAQSQRVSPFFVEWLIVSYADYGGTLEKTLWSLLLGLMLFIAVWKSRWEEGSQAGVSDVVVEARLTMAPPSQLSIATSSVNRLVKEEASYHKELEQQHARIAKLDEDGGDENAEYQLRQEQKAIEETKAMFPALRQRIKDALAKLEQQLEKNEGSADPAEITKAKEAVASAQKAIRKSA